MEMPISVHFQSPSNSSRSIAMLFSCSVYNSSSTSAFNLLVKLYRSALVLVQHADFCGKPNLVMKSVLKIFEVCWCLVFKVSTRAPNPCYLIPALSIFLHFPKLSKDADIQKKSDPVHFVKWIVALCLCFLIS